MYNICVKSDHELHFYSLPFSASPSREDSPDATVKRSRRSLHSKSYIVEINYATKIPLKSVLLALRGAETEKVQDALRVLDIILRQQAANRYPEFDTFNNAVDFETCFAYSNDFCLCRGCLLVRQSFFHDDSRMLTDVGGGVAGCRGLHSSFRPTHGGLSLNIGEKMLYMYLPSSV